MSHRAKILLPAFALALLAGGADTPISLIERANQAYREGRVQRALDLYEEADELKPDDPEILYNWATALTTSDDRGLADRLFRKADALAESDALRARARQNLSHSLFVTASTLASVDPRKAIELFDESADAARAAWRLDNDNIDAARQVETSRLAAQLIRDQLRLAERLQQLSQDQRDEARNSAERARTRREAGQDPQGQSPETPNPEPQEPNEQDPPEQEAEQQPEAPEGESPPSQGDKDPPASGEDQPFNLPGFLRDLLNSGNRTPPEGERHPPPPDGTPPEAPPGEAAQPEPPPAPDPNDSEQREERQPPETPGEPGGPGEESQAPTPGEASPEPRESAGDGEPSRETSAQQREASAEQREMSAQQRGVSEETERLARTLREAMEEDLVAGDREFAEAVLRAIEEARKSQVSAEELLESAELEEASGAQEQAASLLDLAEQMLNRGQEPQQQEGEASEDGGGTPRESSEQTEEEPEGDPIAERLLMKEREERQMRQAYQRRILRGRTAPARDW